MSQDDADSSDDESSTYTSTNVLLGYASKEPTNDSFSQLGGRPTWPTPTSIPSSTLARCRCCNGIMTLLLQLYADLPDCFTGHERRLYIFSCKRKACRRKEGSLRIIRGTKGATRTQKQKDEAAIKAQHRMDDMRRKEQNMDSASKAIEPQKRLGDMMFKSDFKSTNKPAQNPFAKHERQEPERPLDDHYHRPLANPFAPFSNSGPMCTNITSAPPSNTTSNLNEEASSPKTQQLDLQNLSTTFTQKASITSSSPPPNPKPPVQLKAPWPNSRDTPPPYPTYHIDADIETLDPSPPASTSKPSNMDISLDTPNNGDSILEKDAFESHLDKTFLRFADGAAQNPEQVLRYEFGGQPLMYSATDAVGKMLYPLNDARQGGNGNAGVKTAARDMWKGVVKARFPPCGNCGGRREFEVQLMPEAITVLEEGEDLGLDGEGMEWGTVIIGVCGGDCGGYEGGDEEGWGWVEEWAGVQWEEVRS